MRRQLIRVGPLQLFRYIRASSNEMFVKAIEIAAGFTRAICTITRLYGSTSPVPGAATLFLINADGWALTCRHVAEGILSAEHINTQHDAFKAEKAAIAGGKRYRHQLEAVEKKFGYTAGRTVELNANFVDCVDNITDFEVHMHTAYDVALLKFNGFSRVICDRFPVFASTGAELKQGKSLCRLGFPFPEFTNFEYDAASDSIRWRAGAPGTTPRFPIDGMVTRHLMDNTGTIFAFEMSTPGLRGQSGGPAFDVEGRVWGMQSATSHLDLDFDVDTEVLRAGRKRRVTNSPFLHVGNCIHVDVLKDFMHSRGVAFEEG